MKVRAVSWLLAAALAVVAVDADAAAATDARPEDRSVLRQALDELVADGAAGALAELRDDHGTWGGTSGIAELGTARPVPAAGRFRAGSIVKTFMATVVLQLVGEGQLRLDDTVERWLPGLVPDGTRITVRHLLNHTSGLYDYLGDLPLHDPAALVNIRWRTWEPRELVRLATAHRPLFEPGAGWSYSSTNYIVIGLLVQQVTGQPYGTEVQRRIIRPLQLRGTAMPGTYPRIRGPHPHGYLLAVVDGHPNPVDITAFNPSVAGASGELISTAADLNRFFAALAGGRLLREALWREMITPTPPAEQYGLGLMRWELPCGVTAYGHTGDFVGYSSLSAVTAGARRSLTVAVTWGTAVPDDLDAVLTKAFCPPAAPAGSA
ncbi:beta-lactamase family protein [Dactylosporangium sp. NBC_01737]|uniref:serine hydrolase domain-containing protein n=1 Tax=Dactylosporangium sp. NBC_01737 TaxID=2975959 RepID=UPI002E0FE3A6|nr:beta-lactamase family protein [Dactylosporangium sp. NBC_01737]